MPRDVLLLRGVASSHLGPTTIYYDAQLLKPRTKVWMEIGSALAEPAWPK